MKILVLTQLPPFPPDSGPKVKTYHLLRHLAAQHHVTLVCFTRDEQDEANAARLRPLCTELHTVPQPRSAPHKLVAAARSLLGGRPYVVERAASAAMHQLLARLVYAAAAAGKPFDLVHADQLVMAQFAAPLPLPRLLDEHNVAWKQYERIAERRRGLGRWARRRESRLLRRYEGRVCADFEAVTVVSEEDRRGLLAALGRERELPVIPIAVDCAAEPALPRAPAARAILSLAPMRAPLNADGVAWFAREIYPLVQRAVPDARLAICGAEPTPELRALAELDTSIEVAGHVADPRPYVAGAACQIVPLRGGGGMRVQILEALARGVPVVSTTAGYAGMDLVPGRHLLVADTPSDFADAVALLLRDPEFGARLAAAGRQRVLERYDCRAVYPALDAIHAAIAARPAAGRGPAMSQVEQPASA